MSKPYHAEIDSDNLPENSLYQEGYHYIAGVDEVGRGPLAGPVVAAAVVLPPYHKLPGINDSKKLSPRKRELLYTAIFSGALSVGIGIVDHTEIDQTDILTASLKAMALATHNLSCSVDYLLVDGIFAIPSVIPQMAVKKGDSLSVLIAAASVVAKVTRDTMMKDYHHQYPCYNFARNKGYGTKEHRDAIKRYGFSPLHRKTFRGVLHDTPRLFHKT
jgi:ribonuclease HII